MTILHHWQKTTILLKWVGLGSSQSRNSMIGSWRYISVRLSDDLALSVAKIYRHTRGRELPGNYNYTLLAELYDEQSSRSPEIAKMHTIVVHGKVSAFVTRALGHDLKEESLRVELQHIVESSLQRNLDAVLHELEKICDDEKIQPLTYNHYFTDNVQKARMDAMRKEVKRALELTSSDWGQMHISNTRSDWDWLLASLQAHIEVDMDRQACEEASTGALQLITRYANQSHVR